MVDNIEVTQEKKNEQSGTAKPLTVNPQIKQTAQKGLLTPEQRVEAIKKLLENGIAEPLPETGGCMLYARYDTPRGTITVLDTGTGQDHTKFIHLNTIDTPQTATSRAASFEPNGRFVSLSRIVTTTVNESTGATKETYKGHLENQWAERFADDLIITALAAKVAMDKTNK